MPNHPRAQKPIPTCPPATTFEPLAFAQSFDGYRKLWDFAKQTRSILLFGFAQRPLFGRSCPDLIKSKGSDQKQRVASIQKPCGQLARRDSSRRCRHRIRRFTQRLETKGPTASRPKPCPCKNSKESDRTHPEKVSLAQRNSSLKNPVCCEEAASITSDSTHAKLALVIPEAFNRLVAE
jgi:hypothetical protein